MGSAIVSLLEIDNFVKWISHIPEFSAKTFSFLGLFLNFDPSICVVETYDGIEKFWSFFIEFHTSKNEDVPFISHFIIIFILILHSYSWCVLCCFKMLHLIGKILHAHTWSKNFSASFINFYAFHQLVLLPLFMEATYYIWSNKTDYVYKYHMMRKICLLKL